MPKLRAGRSERLVRRSGHDPRHDKSADDQVVVLQVGRGEARSEHDQRTAQALVILTDFFNRVFLCSPYAVAMMPAECQDTKKLRAGAMLVWTAGVVMTLVMAFLYQATGLSLDLWSGRYIFLIVAACIGLSWFYRRVRHDQWIGNGAELVAQIMSILIVGTLLSYAAATLSLPYRDAQLEGLDRAAGLDWRACLDFINAHPLLGTVSNLAYFSMKPQVVVIIGALVINSRFERLQIFALATAFTLIMIIAIFSVMPAVGYFAHLELSPSDSPHFSPSMTYQQMAQLEGIRSGAMRVISFDNLEGIIAFPSFHTAAAVLASWALWPSSTLRIGTVLLNILMVASAPFDGAHYFVDLPAGALVAILGIYLASRLHAYATSMAELDFWRQKNQYVVSNHCSSASENNRALQPGQYL